MRDRSHSETSERLRQHVEMLAGTIGERNVWRPESLAQAAQYIRMTCAEAGLLSGVQAYEARGCRVENIEVIVRGTSTGAGAIVVGAHYDSVAGCPGANDNATGVASVLELARRLAARPGRRTVRFVAFVNEEPPFFQTDAMGSLVYARAARERGDAIDAMLALETMGYYSDEPGSQTYPAPLAGLFPSTGNFIGMVSDLRSARLLWRVRRAFRRATNMPVEAAPAPATLPGVGWSDHWSFWQVGYRAMMVTDTAPYRYPWYHTPEDRPDKVQYDRLSSVVDGLEAAIQTLAARR